MSESMREKKSIVLYFSRADENYAVGYVEKGNTEYLAEFVGEIAHADLYKAEPVVPYSKEYNVCIQEAKQRVGNAPIKEPAPDISAYEVIYIMTPVYWDSCAPELATALQELDFTGKTIRLVVTHEGSGLANVPRDIQKICKGATLLDTLAIKGRDCKNARSKMEEWV